MNDNQSHYLHKDCKNDPLSLKSYMNKMVLINTRDGREHTGVVYTVDPLSKSIILINPSNDKLKMKIIMGDAIDNIKISLESGTSIPELFLPSRKDLTESVISQRKNAVRELLCKNRFPVTETDNILNIQGILSIEPPYDQENCISNNEIVLLRIQKLISNIVI